MEIFTLPNISEIDFTIGAQLTEIPTIIYGAENNFVMDLGTYKQYEIQVERATPSDCDDSSPDQTKWSNGRWYQELENFWDFWQNLTYDDDGKIRGGLGFHYESADNALYPSFTTNVFLTGSMTPSFSVQQLKVSMTLLVARAEEEEADVDYKTITYYITDSVYYQVQYPEGAQMGLSPIPSDKQSAAPKDGSVFSGWKDESGKVHRISDGTAFVVDRDMSFWAVWTAPYKVLVYSEPDEYETTVPTGAELPDRIIAYILGGGGSGGTYTGVGTNVDFIGFNAGGGGGSGQFVSHEFRGLSGGETIKITVGDGGLYLENGERSSVDINMNPVYAEGGYVGGNGASSAISSAKGGQKYIAGGSASSTYPGKGDDGQYTDGMGIPGYGASSYMYKDVQFRGGGGGGGAADLNHTLKGITNILDESEISRRVDTGWMMWGCVSETKYNCEASYESVPAYDLDFGRVDLKCAPKNEGFYMYRVVFYDEANTNRNKSYVISGVYSKSTTGSAVFRSRGGNGSGADRGTMGFLGGGGGGAQSEDSKSAQDVKSIPGGSGLVALLFIKDTV